MALLEWSERYSVESRMMDEQHRKLFDLVNELHEAMKAGQAKTVISRVLDQLVTYTRSHFDSEERALAAVAYPDLAAHVSEHRKLTETVHKLQQEVKAGTVGVTIELMDFLQQWLTNHIMKVDRKYAPFLKS